VEASVIPAAVEWELLEVPAEAEAVVETMPAVLEILHL
jgi:hypothetical protein